MRRSVIDTPSWRAGFVHKDVRGAIVRRGTPWTRAIPRIGTPCRAIRTSFGGCVPCTHRSSTSTRTRGVCKLRELACALRLRACLFLSVAVVPLAYLRSGLSVRQWCKVRILGFACLDPGDRGAGTDIDALQRPGYALFVCKSLGRSKDRAQDFRQAVLLTIAQQELAPPDEPASDVVPRSKRRPGRPSKKRVARDFAGRLAASLRALTCHVRSLWYRPHMPSWARDAFPRAAGEAGMCEGRDVAPLPALAGTPVEVADSPGSEDVVIEIA